MVDTVFADEPIATRTSVAGAVIPRIISPIVPAAAPHPSASSVDMTLPGHATTISNEHGNYTTLSLLQDGHAALYFIYPAADATLCYSFALPSMLPPPRVLSKDALVAAGFTPRAPLPLGDNELLQANFPAII
jgi:hypothetical protein